MTEKTKIRNMEIVMNRWIELSIEYANQRSYLDDLFLVYPLPFLRA